VDSDGLHRGIMKNLLRVIPFLFFAATPPPRKEGKHLFILPGQSNWIQI
jgi:hypothetical protein